MPVVPETPVTPPFAPFHVEAPHWGDLAHASHIDLLPDFPLVEPHLLQDFPKTARAPWPAGKFTRDNWHPGTPPSPWASNDPADSLYRRARELLNRGEYRQAALAFRELSTKFATSEYAPAALYWQAFALYRIGGMTDLREALTALETQRSKYPGSRSESDNATLQARVLAALADRGDANARRQLESSAQSGEQRCESEEDQSVRVEAINALYKNDPETVGPMLQQVLNRKDECSIRLRRSAIFIIGNRRDQAATGILANVARTDPSLDVRVEAISWLGRLGDDAALDVLEALLRTSNEERIQRATVRALAQHPNQRALQRVRGLVERTDAPERLRAEAISTFDRERLTSEEVAWLRTLYPRLDRPSLKQRAVSVIAKAGGPENEAWLLGIVRNEDEPSAVRSTILSRMGQTMAIADLGRVYDAASSRTVREYIISALARRTEAEATDKLIDIVKTGTDPQLRRSAINALTRKKDPRSTKLLMDLISQ
jgi:HEAT repeat protein